MKLILVAVAIEFLVIEEKDVGRLVKSPPLNISVVTWSNFPSEMLNLLACEFRSNCW